MSQPGRTAPPAHTEPPADAARARSRGQAMVEFTLILPLLMLLILGIYQFGQTYADYIQVTNAARDGGRKALVSRSDAPASPTRDGGQERDLVARQDADERDRVAGPAVDAGPNVTVTVTYPYSINLLGFVVASGTLKSATTVRME